MAFEAELMTFGPAVYSSPQENQRAARSAFHTCIALAIMHGVAVAADKITGAFMNSVYA